MYKIVRITNLKNEDVMDYYSVNRIGRIIDINQSTTSVGGRGFLYCIFPDYLKSVYLSKIKRVVVDNNLFIITTLNHIYYLAKISEDEREWW